MSRKARPMLLGPLCAAVAGVTAHLAGLGAPASWTAAITALCAIYWVLEPIPIPATSMIPFAVFPLTGVLDYREVAGAYGHHLILLLLGGFILSRGIEKSGAHRRIALGMVRATGGGGRRLVLGFMLASAACSMWISNTATTLMLLPVAMAVLDGDDDALAIPLLLGIAYAASIGGTATPVGTPPNVIFMGVYQKETGLSYSFLDWMRIGVPVAVVLVPIAWLYLTRRVEIGERRELPELGPWRAAEVRVLVIFSITALAWVFREAPLGGWSGLVGLRGLLPGVPDSVGDSTVAMAAAAALFVIPDGEGGRLLDWKTAEKIPWGLLLLFGGGIAIAGAFKSSGLSTALGGALASLAGLPGPVVVGLIALGVTFLTEVTSNTATTNLLMPVLAAAGLGAGIDPSLFMIPAALSASCAFMLPVATAPNAIMYGTGMVPTRVMAREGLGLNLLGAAAITLVVSVLL